jgi:hypothetical protein
VAKPFAKSPVFRMGEVFMKTFITLGIGGKGMSLVSVVDQEIGGMQTTPVTLIENDQGRFLVAAYGVTRWVRNARQAGWVQVRRGRRREKLRIEEVSAEEGAPVLHEYVQRVSTVRPYFDVPADSPPEAFAAEIEAHPVFKLAGPVA